MTSYINAHARLAAEGVNILNLVPIDDDKSTILFEYSWKDPSQDNKLHWSKSMLPINKNESCIVSKLLDHVRLARKELEDNGE